LRKHFGLSEHVPQTNNFILFDRYFETPKDMPPPPPIYESGGGSGSGRRSTGGSTSSTLPPLAGRGPSPPTAHVTIPPPHATGGRMGSADTAHRGSGGAGAASISTAFALGALGGPQPRTGPPPLPTPIGGGTSSGRGTPMEHLYPRGGGAGGLSSSVAGRSAASAGLSSGGGSSMGVSAALGASCGGGSDGHAGHVSAAPMRRAVSPTRSGAGYDIIAPSMGAIVPPSGGAARRAGAGVGFAAALPHPLTTATVGGPLGGSMGGSMSRPLYGRRS
jgi:alpha-tubulin N-acetyltransferase 1